MSYRSIRRRRGARSEIQTPYNYAELPATIEPARKRRVSETFMATAKKILIIDDNVDAADLTAEALRLFGLHVEVAYGGLEGLAAARVLSPSLIFLDIGMPELNGYQVAAALRADEVLCEVKLVALTAWSDAASMAQCEAAGFDTHLIKPANLESLLKIAQ